MSAKKSTYTKFLLDNGLIFEINRRVLHPFGLALVVDIDRENRRQLAITALAETEDPEGFLYDAEAFGVGIEKFEKFLRKTGQARLDSRKEKLGFIEQEKENEQDIT